MSNLKMDVILAAKICRETPMLGSILESYLCSQPCVVNKNGVIQNGYAVQKISTSQYKGPFVNGQRHGLGELSGLNCMGQEFKFKGMWSNGIKEGHGVLQTDNELFTGHWINDTPNGLGNFKKQSNNGLHEYTGAFKSGVMHGAGVYKFPGGRHVGMFENGLAHGKGTEIVYKHGVYSGEYTKGAKNGKFLFSGIHGTKYDGYFRNDLKCGPGVTTYPCGSVYKGWYKNNQKHGQGSFVWANGSSYKGSLKHGLKHGLGTYMYEATSIFKKYEGQWKNDYPYGVGTITFRNGDQVKASTKKHANSGTTLTRFAKRKRVETSS